MNDNETIIKIYDLFEQGYSINKIAKVTKVEAPEVKRIVSDKYYIASGVKKPSFPVDEIRELAKTKTVRELAEMFGFTEANMYHRLRKHGIVCRKRSRVGENVSPRTLAIMEELRNGATTEDIKNKYGITKQRVSAIKKTTE